MVILWVLLFWLGESLPTGAFVAASEPPVPAPQPSTEADFAALGDSYQQTIRPLLEDYCLDCHSSEAAEGELDLERFVDLARVRSDWRVWQHVAEMLDNGEMPPDARAQPSPVQRQQLREWVQRFLDAEARSSAGDPGPVVLRRLDHAAYTYTIRDLTGVALDPVRDFPVDGAAGEGFTNTGDALVMSPALLEKYIAAAKAIADHAVLLPDRIAFSDGTTRREWTDERLEAIRSLYLRHTTGHRDVSSLDRWTVETPRTVTDGDGRVDLLPYVAALIESRQQLQDDLNAAEGIATAKQLNPKYFRRLAEMLLAQTPSTFLLEHLRHRWAEASASDAPAMVAEIRQWQDQLWKFNSVGHFGSIRSWQEATQPAAPLVAVPDAAQAADSDAAYDDFRSYFPAAMCYARIVPVDEGVTLVLFHREDEHLSRLMLNEAEASQLDQLWEELIFVSQAPLSSVSAFEQLMEFATQDGDPTLFEPLRQPIADAANAFREQVKQSQAAHLDSVFDFATQAYRRPLTATENEQLSGFYDNSIQNGVPHDDAIRLLIARVLASPKFLYRIEQPGPERLPVPVGDWELASRLSYFLWSSMPDHELRAVAMSGNLQRASALSQQTLRMLRDARIRRLATEFACQWLNVRDFDELDEKSEQAFPTFAGIQDDIYEETVLFFTDLFQNDRSVLSMLDADHCFVNAALAAHYGIPDIEGEAWQRVDDARSYGRGGILTLASVLARHSGASRTSPILRGVWVSESLLGERLPRPPQDVPVLPAVVPEGLSERQLIEQHSSDPACAKCHAKIDPYGFTLECFDAIGRYRTTTESGKPIAAHSTLPGGTELAGVEGLRRYLLTERRDDFLDQFCRKLLGFALGRATQLSDEPLIDEMKARLAANDYRFSIAVDTIVQSQPFRNIRGAKTP